MFADPEDRTSAMAGSMPSFSRPGRSWKWVKRGLMGLAATVVAVVVVAAIASGSSASSSAGDKQNELLSRSTAHAFIIPLYQACMAKGSLEPDSSYMCIKKVALTAKGHSMTPFQIIGVFRDLGVDVNSLNFPPI